MNKIFLKLSNLPKDLKYFGDIGLRINAQIVPSNEICSSLTKKEISRCIFALKEIRKKTGLGMALAAPQIGINKRIIVSYYDDNFHIFINPKIIKKSKSKGIYKEMCLSGMPIAADVVRPWIVNVEYTNHNGITKKERFTPRLSRMFQHEIDHLNGILFIDRAQRRSFVFVSNFLKYKKESKLVRLKGKKQIR